MPWLVFVGLLSAIIGALWLISTQNRRSIDPNAEIIIIGAGMSGIAMGIKLLQAGHRRFRILEKDSGVGGTWRVNTYPNCGCDVPARVYQYSFALWSEWDRIWAKQPQILEYCEKVAERYGLAPYIEFNTRVERCEWDEGACQWVVCVSRSGRGERKAKAPARVETLLRANYVVHATGPLRVPRFPSEIKGVYEDGSTEFKGGSWHSAEWPSGRSPKSLARLLKGKRVGVIGTGASSVQLVPHVAAQAQHLTVFQRTPNWIYPKQDAVISPCGKYLRRIPCVGRAFMRLRRLTTYWFMESRFGAWTYGSWMNRLFHYQLKRDILDRLGGDAADKGLVQKCTPNYPPGCKRILFASDWYETMKRDNTTLCSDEIVAVTRNGVATRASKMASKPVKSKTMRSVPSGDGEAKTAQELLSKSAENETRVHKLDVLIFATGFHPFPSPEMGVVGANKQSMREWANDDPATHLGITAPEFPNLFFMLGPNTGLGHNSVVWMVECQCNYVVDLLKKASAVGAVVQITPKRSVVAAFGARVERELKNKVWSHCSSWYRHPRSGKVFALWPNSTPWYWWKTASASLNDYDIKCRKNGQ